MAHPQHADQDHWELNGGSGKPHASPGHHRLHLCRGRHAALRQELPGEEMAVCVCGGAALGGGKEIGGEGEGGKETRRVVVRSDEDRRQCGEGEVGEDMMRQGGRRSGEEM